jgi:hypothetical protein
MQVQPQPGLPVLLVKAMAVKTLVRKDRPDVTIEHQRPRLRSGGEQ